MEIKRLNEERDHAVAEAAVLRRTVLATTWEDGSPILNVEKFAPLATRAAAVLAAAEQYIVSEESVTDPEPIYDALLAAVKAYRASLQDAPDV